MLRMALPKEKDELHELWNMCFDESKEFLDWFFEYRFLPEYCAVYEKDGKIIGCAHSLPCHIFLRGRILPCIVLCAVATHPEHRRQGVSHKIIRFLADTLRSYGIYLIIHRPQTLETYFSMGHYPVSDSKYLHLGAGHDADPCGGFTDIDINENKGALYQCYSRYAKGYSLMISRSFADFALKCGDYLSCNAKCIAVKNGAEIAGYSLYLEDEDKIAAEEFIAENEEMYETLYRGMKRRSAGKELIIRMASDIPIAPAEAEISVLPRSVLGVSDVSGLLSSLNMEGGVIEIKDQFLPQNNGVFELSGKRTDKAPQLRIETGRLLQWISGYKSIEEISAAGNADILDPAIVKTLDAYGKCHCYVIDEY